MTKLMVIALMFVSSVASAFDYQSNAEAKFKTLSATEALAAGYKTRVYSIYMPGTSSWFNPMTELCVNGNTVQTKTPKSYCTTWAATKDGDTRVFTNKNNADDYGSNVRCVEETAPVIVGSPIAYTAEVCATWSSIQDGETKYFTTKNAAENYGGNANCVENKTVNRTIPTTYAVEFYRNSIEDDKYLGSHTYGMAKCATGTTPPVIAN